MNEPSKQSKKPKGGKRPGAGMPKGYVTRKVRARRRGQARALRRADVTAERTMLEIARVAFNDPRGFWDTKGNLRPIHRLSLDQAAALAGFEAIIKNAKAGDGETDLVHKIKFWPKDRALEILAKHFGLYRDRVEHSGSLTLEELIAGSMDPEGAT